MRRHLRLLGCVGLWATTACRSSAEPPPRHPVPPPPTGYAPYGQPAPPPRYPGAPPTGGSPGAAPTPRSPQGPAGQPPAQYGHTASAPVGAADALNRVDMAWLRGRARAILGELIAALPPQQRRRVASIPFVTDDTPGDVNAFAACVDGKALMAVTDGLLSIGAHLARAKASDDVFGGRKVDEYIGFVARHQAPNQPIARPPVGFFDPRHEADARRVRRQHQVFDEMTAFILGHELAHHHLGHLPCTGGTGPLGAGEIARALSGAVPLFNQPNELAADVAGTHNVLAAGRKRAGHAWTEAGALLTMRFFSGLDRMSAVDILFAFERTHPPPPVRVPVIQQTANTFRLTGGAWLPIPTLGQ